MSCSKGSLHGGGNASSVVSNHQQQQQQQQHNTQNNSLSSASAPSSPWRTSSWSTFFPRLGVDGKVRHPTSERRVLMASLTVNRLRFDASQLYGRQAECQVLSDMVLSPPAPRRRPDTKEAQQRPQQQQQQQQDACEQPAVAVGEPAQTAGKGGTSEQDKSKAETKRPTLAPPDDKTTLPCRKTMVLISGVSGVGKTSLALQMAKPVTLAGGWFVQGKYDFSQRSVPYSGLAAACRQLCTGLLMTNIAHTHTTTTTTSSETSATDDEDEELQDHHDKNNHHHQQRMAQLRQALGPAERATILPLVPNLEEVLRVDCHESETEGDDNDDDKAQASTAGTAEKEAKNRFRFAMVKFLSVVASWGPLCLFLDDLQWADVESMLFLEDLIRDMDASSNNGKIHQFILVGCYRSNEVNETHLLAQNLRSFRKIADEEDVSLTEISVSNLEMDAVNEMISHVLNKDMLKTQGLSKIVHHKTLGNPFFVIEFLKSLQDQNLLSYSLGLTEWKWDDATIESKTSATKNVIDLMKARMMDLPPGLSELLPLAACLGATFSESILTILVQVFQKVTNDTELEPIEPHRWLDLCLEQGFLEKVDDKGIYRWFHDKIQESALSLVDMKNQSALKYRVGELLFSNLTPSDLLANSFVVVNLLNECMKMSTIAKDKRAKIASLSCEAAKMSVSAASFQQASIYLRKGAEWLPRGHWQEYYEISRVLFTTGVEVEYVTGDVERQEFYFKSMVQQTQVPLEDKLRCYSPMIDSMNNRQLLNEAIALNEEILAKLGCVFPKRGRLIHTLKGIVVAKAALKRCTTEMIAKLPLIQDVKKNEAIKLLDRLNLSTYYSNSNLLPLVIFKSFQWSLEYGVSPYTPAAFASVALVFCGQLKDPQGARVFAEHAIALLEKWNLDEVASRTLMITYGLILQHSIPLPDTRLPLLRAYQIGMSTGDVQSAFLGIMLYMHSSFFMGRKLVALEEDYCVYAKQMVKYMQVQANYSACMHWQLILNLLGRSDHTSKLIGTAFNEEGDHSAMAPFLHLNRHAMCIIGRYLFGEDEEGAEMSLEIDKNPRLAKEPAWTFVMSHVTQAVMCYGAIRKTGKRKYIRVAEKCHSIVQRQIRQGNPNLSHLEKLASAEKMAMKKNAFKAKLCFEDAARLAARFGFMHDQALINERHGDYMMETMDFSEATYRWKNAVQLYEEWGAKAKVAQVHQKISEMQEMHYLS